MANLNPTMANLESSPLMAPPVPFEAPHELDLEAGPFEQLQCRICLETEGTDFIAPCKCKGTSKYVHRECLDNWRSVKEGFAFSHCTTCKAPYYLRVHVDADRKWRIIKFRFFVTRDILFIFAMVQLVICALAYLVCLVDSYQQYWLGLACGFDNEISFYYICGAVLFLALVGLSGCFMTCYDRRVRNELAQPCIELYLCCCEPRMSADCVSHISTAGESGPESPTSTASESSSEILASTGGRSLYRGCSEILASTGGRSRCRSRSEILASTGGRSRCRSRASSSGGGGEVLSLLLIVGIIVLVLFTIIGIVYGVLVATIVGQRIWQRHNHILAKRMLTKEYVVEDFDEEEGTDD